jgi:lipopolysaccharide biosynthesis regulator YciM
MFPDGDGIMGIEVQNLLWLLLPLAAASGWYAAHRDQRRQRTHSPDGGLSQDYFRGINYLLNEQPDKAIEVFTQMLEVNTETVETHLALGSLFRRRGEVERATRIHQNLIARPTLDKAQRLQALCELAQDYHKAGLLDRAENLFLELAEIQTHAEQALGSLMHIYEQEKDWDKAITAGRRLVTLAGSDLEPVLAQYHCELGERALSAGNFTLACACAMEAIAVDARCVRASILAGRAAAAQGKEHEAIAAWQKIEQQDAEFLDEVIDEITASFRRLNKEPQLLAYLHDVARRQAGMRTLLILTALIGARDGNAAAQIFIAGQLRQQPSVPGLKRLIDLQVALDTPEKNMTLDLVKGILDLLATRQEGYLCRQCGFRGQALHWQCPACHEWIKMLPASSANALLTPDENKITSRASRPLV